jgi:uroporphyrinogen-III synthase
LSKNRAVFEQLRLEGRKPALDDARSRIAAVSRPTARSIREGILCDFPLDCEKTREKARPT